MTIKAPEDIVSLQKWVGKLISAPITKLSKKHMIPALEENFAEEAEILVHPGPFLSPSERIALYRRSYWYRLKNILENVFPTVLRLFGYKDFNKKIVEPYLLQYPSNHYSLRPLGKHLPKWLEEEYHEVDKTLVLSAAKADFGFDFLDAVIDLPPLNPTTMGSHPIFLQPSVYVFKSQFDVFAFRGKMLKEEVEYWYEHDFPEIEWNQKYYYVFFRRGSSVLYKETCLGQYLLLKAFEMGASLENACSLLDDLPEEDQKHAEENIQNWFQEWVQDQWLTIKK